MPNEKLQRESHDDTEHINEESAEATEMAIRTLLCLAIDWLVLHDQTRLQATPVNGMSRNNAHDSQIERMQND